MILRILKWFFIGLIALIALIIISLYATNNEYILRGIRVTYMTGHKTAFLEDYKYFDNRIIEISSPQPWAKSEHYNKFQSTPRLDSIHTSEHSVAYLIIKNDSLYYEKYYGGFSDSSYSNSFSVAKSIVSASLGKALELGYIKSLDDKVITYLPDLKGKYATDVTIRDLVTMRSGLNWDEAYYNPFSITTKAYFYDNLSQAMLQLSIDEQPNQFFVYQSGDTQLLTMVLSKVLPMTLSEFVSTYFWKPMGAEYPAKWQYNEKDGVEKGYCCIASNARDFARFGRLYLHGGKWDEQQLLPESYVQASVNPAAENSLEYGYGWWLSSYESKKVFAMNGHLGQFVIVVPEDNMIIVRLGHQNDNKGLNNPNSAFYQYIHQAYLMLNQ